MVSPTITFRIRPDLKARIRRIAARDKQTTTDVLNQMILMVIDAREDWTPPPNSGVPKLELR